MVDGRQLLDEPAELADRQRQRVASRDDHIADGSGVADVFDHPLFVAAGSVPPFAVHSDPLSCAKSAIHAANGRGDQQSPVGIAMRHAGDGRVLVFLKRVVQFRARLVDPFLGCGDRLNPDRIIRVAGVDQREIIGGNRRAILRFEKFESRDFLGRQGEQLGQLGRRANRMLPLPTPVFPQIIRDIPPVRMPRATLIIASRCRARRRRTRRFCVGQRILRQLTTRRLLGLDADDCRDRQGRERIRRGRTCIPSVHF